MFKKLIGLGLLVAPLLAIAAKDNFIVPFTMIGLRPHEVLKAQYEMADKQTVTCYETRDIGPISIRWSVRGRDAKQELPVELTHNPELPGRAADYKGYLFIINQTSNYNTYITCKYKNY